MIEQRELAPSIIEKSPKLKSPSFKGLHHTRDAKDRIAEGNRRKKVSEETRLKIGEASRLRWSGKNYREKMSQPKNTDHKTKIGLAIAAKWKERDHWLKHIGGRRLWSFTRDHGLLPLALNHNYIERTKVSALNDFFESTKRGKPPPKLSPLIFELRTAVIELSKNSPLTTPKIL